MNLKYEVWYVNEKGNLDYLFQDVYGDYFRMRYRLPATFTRSFKDYDLEKVEVPEDLEDRILQRADYNTGEITVVGDINDLFLRYGKVKK